MTTQNCSHNVDYKKAFTVTKAAGSTVVIEGSLPYEELLKERKGALKHLSKNIKIDGFRTGHIPEEMLIKQIGEMNLIAEMAERALAHAYGHILDAHEIDAIGHPQVEIKKIAADNPFEFTATVAVIPEVKLSDYKSIAKEINKEKTSSEVTDEEVENQIKDILRQKAAYERLQHKAAEQAEKKDASDANTVDLPTPESKTAKAEEDNEAELPELTDEFVKTLGQPGQFESVKDFKTKIREHLEIEKKNQVVSEHRAKLTDAIIETTEMELPTTLIDAEINQIEAQMKEDIKRANLKFDDYLKHINKTEQDLRKEWQPAAEKRAKLQLVLNEIAKAEKIIPDKEAVENQTKILMEQYKDADETRVKIYVASLLLNEAVIKMLEEQN